MSSPKKTDSGKSINIHRTLNVDAKHAALEESIDDEERKIKRKIVVPAPKRKRPESRLPLSARQYQTEKEAYCTFQKETGEPCQPVPTKPDKRKLKRISRAEECLKKDQKQAATAMRQSQREISMIVDDEKDDEFFKKYTEQLKQKLAPAEKAKEIYINQRELDREMEKAKAAIRDEQELRGVMDHIDDYYYNVAVELAELRLKTMKRKIKGYEDLHEWIHDAKEYYEGKEFIEAENKAEMRRVERLIKNVNKKLPKRKRLNILGPRKSISRQPLPQQDSERTVAQMSERSRESIVKPAGEELKPKKKKSKSKKKKSEVRISLEKAEKSDHVSRKESSPKPTASPPKQVQTPRTRSGIPKPVLSKQSAIAIKSSAQKVVKSPKPALQQVKSRTPAKTGIPRPSKTSIQSRVSSKSPSLGPSGSASSAKIPTPKTVRQRSPRAETGRSKTPTKSQTPIGGTFKSPKPGPSGLQHQKKTVPTKSQSPIGGTFKSPKPGPSGLQYQRKLSTPSPKASKTRKVATSERRTPVKSRSPKRDTSVHQILAPRAPSYSPEREIPQKEAPRTAAVKGLEVIEAKRKLKEQYSEAVREASENIKNDRELADYLIYLSNDYNAKLKAIITEGRKQFLSKKPTSESINVGPIKFQPNILPRLLTSTSKFRPGIDTLRTESPYVSSGTSLASKSVPRLQSLVSIPERVEKASRIPARTASQKYLPGTDINRLKSRAKQEYQAALAAIDNQSQNDQERAQEIERLEAKYRAKVNLINNLDAKKLGLKQKYLKDAQDAHKNIADPSDLQRALTDLKNKLIKHLTDLNKAIGEPGDIGPVGDKEIAAEVASKQRDAKIAAEQKLARREKEIKAAFQALAAERAAATKRSIAEAARVSLSKSVMSARRKSLDPAALQARTPFRTPQPSATAQRVAAAKKLAASASRALISKAAPPVGLKSAPTAKSSRRSLPPEQIAKEEAAKRVAAAKAAAASASRASLAKTPRPKAPVTPAVSRPKLPPELGARAAAAQRVAAAKAAAASASRASLAKTPRQKAPVTPATSRPSLPPELAARSAAALRVAAAKAAAASASRASLAKTPRKRAPVTPASSRPSLPPELAARSAAALRVAAAKAAAASASRASLAKTPRARPKPTPKVPTPKTPAIRGASQKYVPGTEAVKLRKLAKETYERAVETAKKDILDEEELADHLDYLKDEYKAQIDFVNKLEVEKLKEKAKYLAGAQEARNTIEDPVAQQEALYALEQNLISRLHKLDEYAGQQPQDVGSISEIDIAARIANQERLDRIAERVKEAKKKAAAQEANKAKKAKKEAEAKEAAKAAKMAALEERRKSMKTPRSRASLAPDRAKSLPRIPKMPAIRVHPQLPVSAGPLAKKTPYRKMVLRKRSDLDPRLKQFLEARKPPPKTPAKTASQRYIGMDLVKLRAKAKDKYQQDMQKAKQSANNEEELTRMIKEIKDQYLSKLSAINKLENAKLAAKSKYLNDVGKAKNEIADPTELQQKIDDLRKSLVAVLKKLDHSAGVEVAATPPVSDVHIAQEVAREQRIARDRRERKKSEARALAEAEKLAAKIARSRVSIVPQRTPAASRSRVTIKAPATVPQQKKSVLQLAKTPSMIRKVQPPKIVHKKKPLTPGLEKYLKEMKPKSEKPVIKKASEKYIAGTDAKQLHAKAKAEFEAQKELAKRQLDNEDAYKDRLKYLEDEYSSKVHFIKNLDSYKALAYQRYLKDVQAARASIKDNDVLKEALDHLKEELKNKHAYIEEAAGMARREGFKSPTAEVKAKISKSIHQMTTAKRPKKPLPPSRQHETPKGRPGMAGKLSRAAILPPTARRPVKPKTPAAEQPEVLKTPEAQQRLLAPKSLMTKAAKEARKKYLEERRALTAPKTKPRAPVKKMVLRKRSELPPNLKKYLEERRAKSKTPVAISASKKYLLVAEINYYKGKAKVNYEKDVENAMRKIWNEEELAKKLDELKKKYREQLIFIDALPERRKKAEIKFLEDRQRIEELYQNDPEMLQLQLQLIEGEYRTHLSQLKEEVEFHRKPPPSKFANMAERLLVPPRRGQSSAELKAAKSRVALMKKASRESRRAATLPLPPASKDKRSRVSVLYKTPSVQPRKSLPALPVPKPVPRQPRRLFKDGKTPAKTPSKTAAPAPKKSVTKKASTPAIPILQARKSTTPIKSLQKARFISKSAQLAREKATPRLKGKNIKEAQDKLTASAVKGWRVPPAARVALNKKKKLEKDLKKIEQAVETNKELLEAVEKPRVEAPISKSSLEPLAVQMGLEPEKQVAQVLGKATKRSSAIKKKIASVPPTVAESLKQRDHSTVSPLAAEEADGLLKMMMNEVEGVNLSGQPGDIVRLIVPSEGPTLPVTGSAVESISKGVITDQVPVREINTLNDRNAEEFTMTVMQQPPHKFPMESIATKRLPEGPIEVPPIEEPRPKEDFIQHDLLLHSFEVENFFQARGSTYPKWFPGIYTVFPEENPKLVLKNSPSEVLHRAWQIMKPKFPVKSP